MAWGLGREQQCNHTSGSTDVVPKGRRTKAESVKRQNDGRTSAAEVDVLTLHYFCVTLIIMHHGVVVP